MNRIRPKNWQHAISFLLEGWEGVVLRMEDVWRGERSQSRRGAANDDAALLRTRVAAGVAQAGLAVAHVELAEPAQKCQEEKRLPSCKC
jgi:hypothetical protein